MEQTINANLNQCIQHSNWLGGTTYHNVCTGASHFVPWGSLDWLGALVVGIMALGGFCLFGLIVYTIRTLD